MRIVADMCFLCPFDGRQVRDLRDICCVFLNLGRGWGHQFESIASATKPFADHKLVLKPEHN